MKIAKRKGELYQKVPNLVRPAQMRNVLAF